jgi:hypothetical protein
MSVSSDVTTGVSEHTRGSRGAARGRPSRAFRSASRSSSAARTGHAPRAGTSGTRSAGQRTRTKRTAPRRRVLGAFVRLLKRLRAEFARLTPRLRRRVLAALALRAPGPLRPLVRGLLDRDERDFWFWWMVVTLALGLLVGLLLAVALAPATALVALAALGIWALVRKTRSEPAAA